MITRVTFRLRSPITSSPVIYLQTFTRLFSSSPPAASYPYPTAAGETDGGSAVYRDARKYARPSTVTWTERPQNSVSFIGNVDYPLRRIATRNDSFGVYTILRVNTSPHSNSSFRILLEMWNELAQRAFQHLKVNDYIYVSGQLGAFSKATPDGVERLRYKVTAKELNYVKHGEPEVNSRRFVNLETEGQSPMEKRRSRLLLWQVFFAHPSEWYDLRKTKKTPKHPDFTHKSTNEALWLSDMDPPWVKKQLELLDSRHSGGPRDVVTSEFLSSRWVSD